MSKKFLSLALALVMCLGLTAPAFATVPDDYSANGYTDPAVENVNFSVAPIGAATIRWEWDDGAMVCEYTAYVFDQDCVVTRKDGLPLTDFVLTDCVDQYWRNIGDKDFPYASVDFAGISADFEHHWLFQFGTDDSVNEGGWSPYMMSKKGLDNLPIEGENFSVTVVEYRPLSAQPTQPTNPTVGGFTDVKTGDFFAEPVKWAVEKGITEGTSETTFSPTADCYTAQILSFLWRANGSPKPTGSNPFTDVKSSDFYADAAIWAYEKGMVSGTTFGGNTLCTRSMAVMYMWKAAGSPSAKAASFADVPAGADYAQAVAWAVEQEITSGTSATTFSPDDICTRGQIVSFLYRGLAK